MQINNFSKTSYPIPKHPSYYDPSQSGVGISVGTTRCYTAVNTKDRIDVIATDNRHRHLPSYVGFDEEKPKCGEIVMERMKNYSNHTVYDIKRILGKHFDSIAVDLLWPFSLINMNGKVKIQTKDFNGSDYLLSPERILAVLLKHMKQKVDDHKHDNLSEAVITIPVSYNHQQIDATLAAAALAGWEVPHILPEPIATCFYYATENKIHENSNILVFDLGGGTLDISIIRVEERNLHILESSSDEYLGGRNFDTLLFNYFNTILKEKYNINVEIDNIKKYKLMLLCQEMKEDLEAIEKITLDVSDLECDKDAHITVTKNDFEKLCNEILVRINFKIRDTLGNLKFSLEEINYVLQVGGGCRMTMIKKLLKNIFSNAQHCSEENPDWTIAYGASLYCCYLQNSKCRDLNEQKIFKYETPISYRLKTENPVSPSIAIELTAKSISASYKNNDLFMSVYDDAINFKTLGKLKTLKTRLFDLRLPEKIRERKDMFWTIGIPDIASQEARKLILEVVEDFRRQPLASPIYDLAYIDEAPIPQQIIPPIRLINRSTAGAISYLQSLRDQERLHTENEGDVYPYLPSRHFIVLFVDDYFVYGAEFKTTDGLVQQKRSYSFEKDFFQKSIQSFNNIHEEEHRIQALKNLWAIIVNDGIKPKNKHKYTKMPVILTYDDTSYIIKNYELAPISQEFVFTPPDKFSLFPSINNKPLQWPDTKKFILKGINVKTRMLAGDADMIDYDVPSGFVGEAIYGVEDTFKASLIRDGEKLPIHRTIFEAKKDISFIINFQSYGFYRGKQMKYVCNVDENGIIDCTQLKQFNVKDYTIL